VGGRLRGVACRNDDGIFSAFKDGAQLERKSEGREQEERDVAACKKKNRGREGYRRLVFTPGSTVTKPLAQKEPCDSLILDYVKRGGELWRAEGIFQGRWYE